MAQVIGVPRETFAGEKRVATVPEVVEKLIKLGFCVAVESGRGRGGELPDEAYRAAGADVVGDLWGSADVIFKVRAPSAVEVQKLRAGQTLIGSSGRRRTPS